MLLPKITEEDIEKAKRSWELYRKSRTPERLEWDKLADWKKESLISSASMGRLKEEAMNYIKELNERKR